ncbi:MAG: GNAT family protein [Rubrivivax sp.]|nr:GNAT family protein [Rubrivivax sp.]
MMTAAPLPVLHGERVQLRPMHTSDITDQHAAWLNDPEVVRHSNQRFVHHTVDSSLRYLQSFEGSANLYASVRLAAGDRAIGTLTAYRSLHHGTADIGILMGDRRCWGQGLGLQAFQLMADWLATQPGLRKLTCGMLASNHGMLKIAQRAGFTREAVRVAQELVDGQPTDIVLFARFVHARPN